MVGGAPLGTTPTSWEGCGDDRTIVTGAGVRDCDIIGKVAPSDSERFCTPEARGTAGLEPSPGLVRCDPTVVWCIAIPVGAVSG